jgi:flagellar hook-associated protein 3 FlgL
MLIRPTQASSFSLLESGLLMNLAKLTRAQEQIATGKRIVRPSDDPAGATRALGLGSQISTLDRFFAAVQDGGTLLDRAASSVQESSDLMSSARELVVQGMNGTLSDGDRRTLATSLEQIRARLLDVANQDTNSHFVFAGTATNTRPFVESTVAGVKQVRYVGNAEPLEVQSGLDARLKTTLPGSDIYTRDDRSGTRYAGLTGATHGTSADQGSGYVRLYARHDATNATLGAGLALVNGGANDTVLNSHSLVVDAAANTVQLDGGPVLSIPTASASNVADFVVRDASGAELHLDFTGYTGVNYSGTVTGAGSLSLDGTNYTAISFTESDLELIDNSRDVVLHVDTRAMSRAGAEMVTFGGAVNAFDTMQGIIDDLNNTDGLPAADVTDRMVNWLGELDRNHENVLSALGKLGALSQHAQTVGTALSDEIDGLTILRSNVEDADLSLVTLDMARAEQTLQLVQATSARMLQNSLLNFLR